MAILRRILRLIRPNRKAPRREYDKEVLYAGWVNAPRLPPPLSTSAFIMGRTERRYFSASTPRRRLLRLRRSPWCGDLAPNGYPRSWG